MKNASLILELLFTSFILLVLIVLINSVFIYSAIETPNFASVFISFATVIVSLLSLYAFIVVYRDRFKED